MMKSSFNKMFNVSIIFTSIILFINSSSSFFMWMWMELNFIAFMSLMSTENFNNNKKPILSYFNIQLISSTLMLITLISKNFDLYTLNNNDFNSIMFAMSILMKMGLYPFSKWYTFTIKNSSWINILILSTLQKIIPLIFLMLFFPMYLIPFIIFSALLSSISMINSSNIKHIYALSSINHSSWLMISLKFNSNSWMLYLILYFILSANLCLMMNKLKLNYIWEMYFNKMNSTMKFSIIIMLLSLSGLPPMTIFFPKISLISLFINNNMLISMSLILSSMISMFMYLFLCSSIILYYKMNLLNKSYISSKWIIIMTTLSSFIPILFYFSYY